MVVHVLTSTTAAAVEAAATAAGAFPGSAALTKLAGFAPWGPGRTAFAFFACAAAGCFSKAVFAAS
jgi:hypothetical protein